MRMRNFAAMALLGATLVIGAAPAMAAPTGEATAAAAPLVRITGPFKDMKTCKKSEKARAKTNAILRHCGRGSGGPISYSWFA